eukprot:34303-Eustigmatos_ZCMA.PRE.1
MYVRGAAERSEVDVSSVPARLCVAEGPEARKGEVCVAEVVNSTDLEVCRWIDGTLALLQIDGLGLQTV